MPNPIRINRIPMRSEPTVLVNAAKSTGTYNVSLVGIVPKNTLKVLLMGYITVAGGTSSQISILDVSGTVFAISLWGTQVSAGNAPFYCMLPIGPTLAFSYVIATGNTSLVYMVMTWVGVSTDELYATT